MFNSQVKMVAEFILHKRRPYKILMLNLHNFLSGTAIPSTFTKKIWNYLLYRKEQYEIF